MIGRSRKSGPDFHPTVQMRRRSGPVVAGFGPVGSGSYG